MCFANLKSPLSVPATKGVPLFSSRSASKTIQNSECREKSSVSSTSIAKEQAGRRMTNNKLIVTMTMFSFDEEVAKTPISMQPLPHWPSLFSHSKDECKPKKHLGQKKSKT
jgi:hypothetical protein